MRAAPIDYLKKHGFDFKSAESPDIYTHLESTFANPGHTGSKFSALSQDLITMLINRGEEALLSELMERHRKTGKLATVKQVIEMPFVVGTDSLVELKDDDKKHVIELIDQPGTRNERVIQVLPAQADAIPVTHHITVTGGLYADGHTTGFFSLQAGRASRDGKKAAMLLTADDIRSLLHEMEARIEDIGLISEHEARAMIAKARKALNLR